MDPIDPIEYEIYDNTDYFDETNFNGMDIIQQVDAEFPGTEVQRAKLIKIRWLINFTSLSND